MESTLLMRFVHFPDRQGVIHQGEIVAVHPQPIEEDIAIVVLCEDKKFHTVYLGNCTDGLAPKPEDEERQDRKR